MTSTFPRGGARAIALLLAAFAAATSVPLELRAQSTPAPNFDALEDQLGAWYMYFFVARFGEPGRSRERSRTASDEPRGQWGVQGDLQLRQWNIAGDLEQLLLRGGITYTPARLKGTFTLGYGNITSGQFGRDRDATVSESRVYQEALLPHRLADRVLLTHRFRFEQRFNEGQDFRTRFRYNLFLNVPLNGTGLGDGVWYVALYNELFVNGERDIGDGRAVELFDRNRTYAGLGYGLSPKLRIQAGAMQQTTDAWSKTQLQLSLHQTW